MILLEVDCKELSNSCDLLRKIRDEFCKLEYVYMNLNDTITYEYCDNEACLNDIVTSNNYHDYPVCLVLKNLNSLDAFMNKDYQNSIIAIFERAHVQYGDDFIYELYDHEIEKPTESVTLKFVKLDKEYGNEEEQRNYEVNCNE